MTTRMDLLRQLGPRTRAARYEGTPCRKNPEKHGGIRYVSTGQCVGCIHEANARRALEKKTDGAP